MRKSHRAAVALLGMVALAGCKPVAAHPADSTGRASGDVVVATGTSRTGGHEQHYAECGPDRHAQTGEYRVLIPASLEDGLDEGSPCPEGSREPMPTDEHSDMHSDLSQAMQQPMSYEGGSTGSDCGEWGTDDPVEAQRLAAECGPLTKGDLS